jgi:hypothetical protein
MSALAAIDPHATAAADPDHAHDPDGALVYDPRCWWCRQVTAQAPPTAMAGAGGGS